MEVESGGPSSLPSLPTRISVNSSSSSSSGKGSSCRKPQTVIRRASSQMDVNTTGGMIWLVVCFIGIMGSFIAYGIVMEYATSGGRKLHELSLIFVTSLLYSGTAYVGRYVRAEKPTTVAPSRLMVLAITSMGSTYCSVRSLRYVFLLVYLLFYSFIYLFIYLFIYSFIYLFTQILLRSLPPSLSPSLPSRYVIYPVQVLAKSCCKPILHHAHGRHHGRQKKYPLMKKNINFPPPNLFPPSLPPSLPPSIPSIVSPLFLPPDT